MNDDAIIFDQSTAKLMRGKNEIARGIFHARKDGVVQVVELAVVEKHRRTGCGSQLLTAMVKKLRPKKMWIAVGHKSQVIGRAFLTKHGFHHISTTCNLLRDEDLLIYVKSWI